MKSPHAKKNPVFVEGEDFDVASVAKVMPKNVMCPIFSVSNVTGEGIPKLKEYISLLNSRVRTGGKFGTPNDPVEFHIDRVYVI